ncbi:hypothetical protein NDU88_008911 [Pleurodeles waltl]|uniref:Uncharacterized protein n=1 Tax=Pleurodeles waltl TaxID=8319 RepID=A0AAV7RWW1_PLEWA|nr:hypothetical protein NDU88_008911 [Pleurodeles waltl]
MVLAAVEQFGTSLEHTYVTLEGEIENREDDLTLRHVDHCKLTDKLCSVKQTIAELAPKTCEVETSLQSLADQVHVLESRAEDADGYPRRSNICVVSLLDGVEE